MTTETFTSNRYDLTYWTDEYGFRHRRSEQEIETIILTEKLQNVLNSSSLSDDDKQRLRALSAEYVVACAPLPAGMDEGTDYDEIRRTMLGYMSSDFPEATKLDSAGLRRMQGNSGKTKIMIDGRPLSVEELEVVYMLIEPSAVVLDRAVEDAAYFVGNHIGEQPAEASTDDSEPKSPAEYDIDWYEADEQPSIEEAHTLGDELRPLKDQLRHLGGIVISITGRRPRVTVADENYEKIAS